MNGTVFSIHQVDWILSSSFYMEYGAHRRYSQFGRFARRALCVGAMLYLLGCLGCASWQRRMMYFPPVFDSAKADELGAAAKLERWRGPAGQALGWKRLSPVQPAAGQVLVLHGNAGCAIWCSRFADAIQQTAALDVFMVEYPGYADRPGKPTEIALEQSASEAFECLAPTKPTYLVGESLGTGVATYLAGKYPQRTQGVVLLGPFNSMVDLGKYHAPALPVRLILRDRYPSEDHLKFYHGPVAMLVGGKDNVIPAKFGRRLYEGYAGPKRLWEFPEADHGAVMNQSPEVWKQVFDFVQGAGAE